MSRPSLLPPRCPPTRALDSTKKDDELHAKHLIRFPSHDSLFEEHPSWLDELLTDSDTSPKGIFHRRSASDSVAILEAPANIHCPISPANEGKRDMISTIALPKTPENKEGSANCSGFEASCVYGPNSPRQKSKLSSSEVTALLENIPWNPLQYVAVDFPTCETINESNVKRDFHNATGDLDPEKAARRRSGQRSRVRKLQYIAELERTIEVYQTMGAELAAGVASLFQQRVALSVENKKIRQQIAILRQEKMIRDGQYQSLKNEAERLKVIFGRHRRSQSAASCFEMGTVEADPSGTSRQLLDIGKLGLGGGAVPLGHGFGC